MADLPDEIALGRLISCLGDKSRAGDGGREIDKAAEAEGRLVE